MKRQYMTPAMETVNMQQEDLICASPVNPAEGILLEGVATDGEEFAPARPEAVLGLDAFNFLSF